MGNFTKNLGISLACSFQTCIDILLGQYTCPSNTQTVTHKSLDSV